MSGIGIVILAAGSSSRMTNSKQMLEIEGLSLLRRSVITASQVSGKVVTVLGAKYKQHKHEIEDLNTEIAFNLDWQKGMGSSLKFGLTHIHKHYPNLDAVIFMVCDQPRLDVEVIHELIKAYSKGHHIVASGYNGAVGVPALFDREYFKRLLKIPDEKGAKILFDNYPVYAVDFSQGAIDIDTDEDWQLFNRPG